jgi:DNA-binding GntR family transcriptional regulator
VAPGADVVRARRLRLTDGEPLALLTNHLPAGVVDLTAGHLERHGLYETLRASGVNLRIANQTIGARGATSTAPTATPSPSPSSNAEPRRWRAPGGDRGAGAVTART